MTLSRIVLFVHILGVLGMFIGMGLQWTIALRLRRARTLAQVREWTSLIVVAGRLEPASGVLILGAGIYLMVSDWGMTPWIAVSLAAMAIMLALGMGVTARQLGAVRRAASAAGGASDVISPELERRIHDPILWVSAQMAGSTALGIVFLMTVKPDLIGSLAVVVAALALGTVVGGWSAPQRRRPRAARSAAIAMEDRALG